MYFLWHESGGAFHCTGVSGPIKDTSNPTFTFGHRSDGIAKSLIMRMKIVVSSIKTGVEA